MTSEMSVPTPERRRASQDPSVGVFGNVAQKGFNWIYLKRFAFLAITLALVIRTIPEFIAGTLPLGFDTVWSYAPFVKAVETEGFGAAILEEGSRRSAPFMYLLLGIAAVATQAEPFFVTKAAAPLLHGFLVFSMYYFARARLGWSRRRSFYVIVLTSVYFVALRFSWDMYKNTLGFSFLVLALAHLRTDGAPRSWALFGILGTLSVLASELTAVLLGAVTGVYLVRELIRRRVPHPVLLGISAIAFVAALIYLRLLLPPQVAFSPLPPYPAPSSILYNYVGMDNVVYSFPTIGSIYATALILSAIVLGPLLPAAWLGIRREKRVWIWAAVLAVGAFSLLVVPWAGVPLWHRWLLMLVFPILLLAASGLSRFNRAGVRAFLAVLLVLAGTFMVLPPEQAFPLYTSEYTLRYLPSSMMQNTVPLQDSPNVVNALRWLDELDLRNSVLVAHFSFVGWGRVFVETMEVYEFREPFQVDAGNFSGYAQVFLVYWVKDQGWYDADSIPRSTNEVYRSGRIAIYEYLTTSTF